MWAGVILGILVLAIAAVYLIGRMLPVAHIAERSASLPRPPQDVWDVITAVERASEWRKDLKGVELLDTADGALRWRESGKEGALTLAEESAEPPRRWVVRLDDPTLPFGGRWIYSLDAEGTGTRLTLREEGEVYHPIFRFMSRFVMGHHGTIDAYLRHLSAHFAR